jgi:hypothetical protein
MFTLKVASRHSRASGNPVLVPARAHQLSKSALGSRFRGNDAGNEAVDATTLGGKSNASSTSSECAPTFVRLASAA